MSKTIVYVIRHCEARGNIDRYFQGHTDGAVTENGKLQCRLLAEHFRDIPIDAVYSSPLSRAKFTAKAVNAYHSRDIQIEPDFMEIHGGRWEGKRWADVSSLFPEESRLWDETPWEFAPQGGESMKSVYERIWRGVYRAASENQGKSIAIASHGCAIRNLLCRLLFNDIQRVSEVPWCDNTGYSVIEFDGKMKPQLLVINSSTHLDEESSTLAKQEWWKK